MITLVIFGLLALWIGVGGALLLWGASPGTGAMQRRLSHRIRGTGQSVKVTLTAVPPVVEETAAEHDVVLLLDHSGSMGAAPGSPLREMIRATESFVRQLPRTVRLAVVAFDHTTECLCGFTGDKHRVVRAIGAITPGGGTSIAGALKRSVELLETARPSAQPVVVLFSDGLDSLDEVRGAADSLHVHPRRPVTYCASFGSSDKLPVMEAVAGDRHRVFLTGTFDGLVALFTSLAAEVSGQRAVAGLLHEEASAPRPFSLEDVPGSTPVDIRAEATTNMIWPLPQFDGVATPVAYALRAECVGWYKIAASSGRVTWRMPDGQVVSCEGARPNRMLVLPYWATWAWPIANPLLMLLLAPWLRCPAPPPMAAAQATPEPPEIALPPPQPTPRESIFQPAVERALIISLGDEGALSAAKLRHRLHEREIPADRVGFLAIRVGPSKAVRHDPGGVLPAELLWLGTDLWPYVSGLRDATLPDTRSWLPMHRWLAEGQPLTTVRGITGDRAKARLCVLLDPEPLARRLDSALGAHPGEDISVVIVGAAEEAETTGLIGEVAHMVAAHGKSVTAVLMPAERGHPADGPIVAFADEMARMLSRRSDTILSDRGGERSMARHLFDRVFVVKKVSAGPGQAAAAAAAFVWTLLSSRPMAQQLAAMRTETACMIDIRFAELPQRTLWQWVREHTLEAAVVRDWLAIGGKADSRPDIDAGDVTRLVDLFWSGNVAGRDGPLLLATAAKLRAEPTRLIMLLDGGANQPIDRPYYEQKAFCDRERQIFARYLEAWCEGEFVLMAHRRRSGLPELRAAAEMIRIAFATLNDELQAVARDPDIASFVWFSAALLAEMRSTLTQLIDTLDEWENTLFGAGVTAREGRDGVPSVTASIARATHIADLSARRWQTFDTLTREPFAAWCAQHVPNLIDNLRFSVTCRPETPVEVRLRIINKSFGPGDDIARALRDVLDRYRRSVLTWPDAPWLSPQTGPLADNGSCLGIGRYASHAFGPSVNVVDDGDPAEALALTAAERPIHDALGVNVRAGTQDYVWPEEANAARVRSLIAHVAQRDAAPFSPLAVSLLREPHILLSFLAETAAGRVDIQRGTIEIQRGGRRFGLTEAGIRGPDLAAFEAAADHAVILLLAHDGTPLATPPLFSDIVDPAWVDDASFAAALDASPIGRLFAEHPGWRMWHDLARGVFLDHASLERVLA
nr:vWA domain-containing protein [uncultured Rhodopila sp.]